MSAEKVREEGYYWVRYNGDRTIMKYMYNYMHGYLWYQIGWPSPVKESDIEYIDEKRLTHE